VNWGEAVGRARALISDYNGQGIRPTLRQVHYRLASEGVGGYQNTSSCYKGLSERLVRARMQGLVPWGALADHVRYRWWLKPTGGQVPDVEELVDRATEDMGEDPWEAMGRRVVVWLEKDALAELVYGAVGGYYVPLSVSRGYSSWTFVHENLDVLDSGAEVEVLYLGDHDPSGLDIERFTKEAMEHFGVEFDLRRVALTYEQVQAYGLLPNPTKKADPRAKEYVSRYGDECWELDALEPRTLRTVVKDAVKSKIDLKVWSEVAERNERARERARRELRRRLKG
jgi:hypothetical protein